MPATISHALSMTTPDDPAYENKPSNWNATHALTLDAVGSEIVGAFSNANGLSFGLSAGAVTASHNALTTAAQSNHSHGNPQLNLTNLTGTTASNSAGFTLSLSAAAGVAPDGVNILAAGTQTANTTGTVLFSNANGITFGMSNSSIITAQHNAITTGMASNRGSDFVQATAAFAGTSASGTIASNGISVSIGPYITTAMLSNAVTLSNIRISGGTTSNLLSALTFGDANGISFGLNASTMTASHNGLTSQSNQNVTAGNGGFAFQTLSFSNLNGISFGTSAGSAITASHNGLTTAALSDHSHGNPQLNLTNLSGTTASNSAGFTLSLSAAAPGAVAITQSIGMSTQTAGGATGGTTGYATGDDVLYHFVPGSNITMSQSVNGASATLSIYGPSAGGVTLTEHEQRMRISAAGTVMANSLVSIQPFTLQNYLAASYVRLAGSFNVASAANNSSAYVDVSYSGVIYSRNSTALSSIVSFSNSLTATWSSNATGTVTGVKALTATFAQSTFSPGVYWMAVHMSTTNSATGGAATTALANSVSMILSGSIESAVQLVKHWTGQSANSQGLIYGLGVISTGATRASIGFSDYTVTGTRAVLAELYFGLMANTWQA